MATKPLPANKQGRKDQGRDGRRATRRLTDQAIVPKTGYKGYRKPDPKPEPKQDPKKS